MKLVYADESGEREHTDVFVMAGLLVDAYRLRTCTAAFDRMITVFLAKHPGAPKELKTKAFINGDGGWSKVDAAERQANLPTLRATDQFVAKHESRPSPPVLRRSASLQPPSGPREGCDEFHDFETSSSRSPWRSWWPTMAAPCPLLAQLPQVRSSPGAKARRSGRKPVSTSCPCRAACRTGRPAPITQWNHG